MVRSVINKILRSFGWKLVRFSPSQIIPPEIPDPESYGAPVDHSRLYRPWDARSFDLWHTEAVRTHTMLSRQKLYYLHMLLRQTRSISGDVFEAGAGSGGSSRLIVDTMRKYEIREKKLWVLDTFAGYSGVDTNRDGHHVKNGDMPCAGAEEVSALLAQPDIEIRIVKGNIPDSLQQVTTSAISFAHIDVNLYQPTAAAFRFCIERMSVGGVIVFDDYNWPATVGARRAIDEVATAYGQDIISMAECTQAFLIKH